MKRKYIIFGLIIVLLIGIAYAAKDSVLTEKSRTVKDNGIEITYELVETISMQDLIESSDNLKQEKDAYLREIAFAEQTIEKSNAEIERIDDELAKNDKSIRDIKAGTPKP